MLLPCAFGQTVDNDPKVKQEVLDRISSIIGEMAFVPGIDFSKWPSFIKEEKSEIDAAQTDEDFQRAVNAALHKFGASHVLLMTPRMSQTRRTGSTVGIGVSTQPVGEGLTVIRVIKDSPAEKAGLTPGDTIVELDGKPISSLKGISGEEGTEVDIKVQHPDGKSDEYKITRKKYSTVRKPELVWVDKDTAQLKIYSFETGYDRAVIEDLVTEAHSAKNLILDLRYNGGGAVSNLQHLLGILVPGKRPFGTFVRRSSADEFAARTGGKSTDLVAIARWAEPKFLAFHRPGAPTYSGRLAEIVNRFSGSASEIAAAALHDILGAPIIGTKSAGAVLASVIVPASNDFMLQFPIEDYVTIKGVRLEGTGVVPNIEAPDVNFADRDAKDIAVEKASAYFGQANFLEVMELGGGSFGLNWPWL